VKFERMIVNQHNRKEASASLGCEIREVLIFHKD
jgi:hypothetical protein